MAVRTAIFVMPASGVEFSALFGAFYRDFGGFHSRLAEKTKKK
jgi:hypothetical protein